MKWRQSNEEICNQTYLSADSYFVCNYIFIPISYSFEEYAILYLFVLFCALFVQTVNLVSFSRKTLKERVGG